MLSTSTSVPSKVETLPDDNDNDKYDDKNNVHGCQYMLSANVGATQVLNDLWLWHTI